MTDQKPGIALVINTHSRRAERFFFNVLDALAEAGLVVTDIYPVRNPDLLEESVQKAIAAKPSMVIVGGGDGTLSALVDYFVNTEVILGILPLGTANSFIRSLQIPHDIKAAVDVLANGKVQKIDVGKMNDTYFANVVSFGYTTLVARKLSTGMKRYFGQLGYAIIGIRQALLAKPFTLTIKYDGLVEKVSTYQVIVANGSYYGPTSLAKEATVNNGKLVLLTMSDMGRLSLLIAWLGTLFGRSLAYHGANHISLTSFSLEANPIQSVSIDGEVSYKTPLTFESVPEAVKVMVPNSFRSKKRLA
jgi:YegS/Rv2252/BmrU family lipid kinase